MGQILQLSKSGTDTSPPPRQAKLAAVTGARAGDDQAAACSEDSIEYLSKARVPSRQPRFVRFRI
jgi:hypothetical protein